MISLRDHADVLKMLTDQYLVSKVEFVENIKSWSKKHKVDLNEPDQPMKLVPEDNTLSLIVQSYISHGELDNIILALGVRWSMIDNASNIDNMLNSVKKRLAYCFLKEYARTIPEFQGDDLKEDKWVLDAMEKLEFFKE